MLSPLIRTVATGLLLSLVGCIATQGPLSPADRASLGRMKVKSALGDEYAFVHVGTTVFNNKRYTVPLPNWGLDHWVERTTVQALQSYGASGSTPGTQVSSGRMYVGGSKAEQAAVLDEAAREGFDTVVLVNYFSSDNSPQFAGSYYGLYSRETLGKRSTCTFVNFAVRVMRVKGSAEIGTEYVTSCAPIQTVSWKASFNDYSSDEKAQLKQQLEGQIERGVQAALQRLALVTQVK